jgi:hypothetical protein
MPSPQKMFTKAKSQLGRVRGWSTFARPASAVQEADPVELAREAHGVQELGRAYAGLVITRAARQKIQTLHKHDDEAKDAKRLRRRQSVDNYLTTHS